MLTSLSSARLRVQSTKVEIPRRSERIRRAVKIAALAESRFDRKSRAQETLDWARTALRLHVSADKSDEAIHLGFLCLLIAIEEAAAAELYFETDPSLYEQAVLRQYWGIPEELRTEIDKEYDLSLISEAPILGGLGTASAWNLARLDTLAREVRASFRNNLLTGTLLEEDLEASCRARDDSQGWDCKDYAQKYPTLAIQAVNEVLFEQHGYKGRADKEDPRYHHLPHVVEQGGGANIVLTILYLEICKRIGLPMHTAILEEGKYAIVWPVSGPLMLAGQEVVIDVYSGGALFLLREVWELFDLDEDRLTPASNRMIICALLSGLREVHWCKAIGGKADLQRVKALPLTAHAVLMDISGYPKRAGYQIERAIAAAQRCCWILPDDRSHKIFHAVLLYSANQNAMALRTLANINDGIEIRTFKFLLRTLNRAQKRGLLQS